MMQLSPRKLLIGVAISALLAGPVFAEGEDPVVDDVPTVVEEPEVLVDPMPEDGDGVTVGSEGEDSDPSTGGPDVFPGGDPDFCEACGGTPVNDDDGGMDTTGVEPRETTSAGRSQSSHSTTCSGNTLNMYCKD